MNAFPAESSASETYVVATMLAHQVPTATVALTTKVFTIALSLQILLISHHSIQLLYSLIRLEYINHETLVLAPLLLISSL